MNKFISYFVLFRSFESLLLAGTWVTLLILVERTDFSFLLLIGMIVWLTNAGITSWNDSLDLKEDSISHPERPIPSGIISIREARIVGTMFFISAILLAFSINLISVIYILSAIIIGIGYSLVSKKQFLVKNMTVTFAIFFGLVIAINLFSSNPSSTVYIFILSIALMLSGYEIIKDFHDVVGDKKAGIETVPLKFWNGATTISIFLFFTLSCLLMVLALLLMSLIFEAFIALLATIGIIFPLYWLIRNPFPKYAEPIRKIVIVIIGIALLIVTNSIYFKAIGLI
ncbi:MAG: Digeranylgeranylglyceryl phosphate synthase [Candidatus Heimdallarchaeota archaeon LC_3]|nr:MAG: Digeranylgeranylglyceryl phosphate synthase [Candidatus Heimdallarchaeota archaeon LC_3]